MSNSADEYAYPIRSGVWSLTLDELLVISRIQGVASTGEQASDMSRIVQQDSMQNWKDCVWFPYRSKQSDFQRKFRFGSS